MLNVAGVYYSPDVVVISENYKDFSNATEEVSDIVEDMEIDQSVAAGTDWYNTLNTCELSISTYLVIHGKWVTSVFA